MAKGINYPPQWVNYVYDVYKFRVIKWYVGIVLPYEGYEWNNLTSLLSKIKEVKMKQDTFVKPSAGLYHLYVLQCKDNKWYVGISKNPQERFKKHKSGSGAFFTKKHKPIKIYKTKPLGKMTYDEAEYYENLCTLAWKKAYGIGKVSGGEYVHDKIKRRDLIPVVNEMSDADARKIIMPVHPKVKRIIVKKKNYSPDFTKPKLGKKTGTDGLRGLIKKV